MYRISEKIPTSDQSQILDHKKKMIENFTNQVLSDDFLGLFSVASFGATSTSFVSEYMLYGDDPMTLTSLKNAIVELFERESINEFAMDLLSYQKKEEPSENLIESYVASKETYVEE
jgi:hypothetical protein